MPVRRYLRHLAWKTTERCQGAHEPPGKAADGQAASRHPPQGMDQTAAAVVMQTFELDPLEGRKPVTGIQQPREGFGQVREVCPTVSVAARRIDDAPDRSARLDHCLAQPVRPRAGTEKITRAQNQ